MYEPGAHVCLRHVCCIKIQEAELGTTLCGPLSSVASGTMQSSTWHVGTLRSAVALVSSIVHMTTGRILWIELVGGGWLLLTYGSRDGGETDRKQKGISKD